MENLSVIVLGNIFMKYSSAEVSLVCGFKMMFKNFFYTCGDSKFVVCEI